MSVFSDPGSLVLIVGAVAIIAFLVHGLWFSGMPENRRLNKADPHDDELRRSHSAGKVRIVNTETSSGTAEAAAPAAAENSPKRPEPEEVEFPEIKELSPAEAENYEHGARQEEPQEEEALPAIIQINLVAAPDRPYRGEDIEKLCSYYGILRGELDIYYVYEKPETLENEVFRMCSLTPPYHFPPRMQDYSTPAMALYMSCPERGKGVAYFKAMQMAAELIVNELGGTMQDNERNNFTEEQLQQLQQRLQAYDAESSGS